MTTDTIALASERLDGEPLLQVVMRNGVRTDAGRRPLSEARALAATQLNALPDRLRVLAPSAEPYVVSLSPALDREVASLVTRLEQPKQR